MSQPAYGSFGMNSQGRTWSQSSQDAPPASPNPFARKSMTSSQSFNFGSQGPSTPKPDRRARPQSPYRNVGSYPRGSSSSADSGRDSLIETPLTPRPNRSESPSRSSEQLQTRMVASVSVIVDDLKRELKTQWEELRGDIKKNEAKMMDEFRQKMQELKEEKEAGRRELKALIQDFEKPNISIQEISNLLDDIQSSLTIIIEKTVKENQKSFNLRELQKMIETAIEGLTKKMDEIKTSQKEVSEKIEGLENGLKGAEQTMGVDTEKESGKNKSKDENEPLSTRQAPSYQSCTFYNFYEDSDKKKTKRVKLAPRNSLFDSDEEQTGSGGHLWLWEKAISPRSGLFRWHPTFYEP